MSLLSIRLTDQLLSEVRIRSKALHMSQAKYIHTAIENMNEKFYVANLNKDLNGQAYASERKVS